MEHMKYFEDLSKEERLGLVEAQLDGKTIEFWDGQGWLRTLSGESLFYYSDVRYRVAKTKDEFTNWDVLPPEYKWIARDEDGGAYAFTEEPSPLCYRWGSEQDEHFIKVTLLTCYKQGTVDWKDSLIERPE